MKILGLCLIFAIFLGGSCRLLTEASCGFEYVYYPASAVTTVSSGAYVVPITTAGSTRTVYTTSSYVPITVYSMRKGEKNWRVSAVDESQNKGLNVKGELFEKDNNGVQWFSHDKVDKKDQDFKTALARCQGYYREMSSRKAFRTKETESKVKLESDLFDNSSKTTQAPKVEAKEPQKVESVKKVEEKSANKVEVAKVEINKKEEVKEASKKEDVPKKEESQVDKVNTPIDNKNNKLGANARFLEKKQDFEDEDAELEKFSGDKKESKSEKKQLVEKAVADKKKEAAPAKAKKGKSKGSAKEEAEAEDDEVLEEDANDAKNNKDQEEDDGENSADEGNGEEERNEDENSDDIEEEVPDEEDNEYGDDENTVQDNVETEGVMDMQDEKDLEEKESELKHDLNPYNENNPDLL